MRFLKCSIHDPRNPAKQFYLQVRESVVAEVSDSKDDDGRQWQFKTRFCGCRNLIFKGMVLFSALPSEGYIVCDRPAYKNDVCKDQIRLQYFRSVTELLTSPLLSTHLYVLYVDSWQEEVAIGPLSKSDLNGFIT